ncbi:TetR/AcrR family transcriptional regulator [Candidatus Chlorohelix sp.]|uniref:TetR/AcrR family transcriptional regulator n=1 Tax=Candidatus Chlorohelix sp. TaxID=3139201 RepID=UPI003020EC79
MQQTHDSYSLILNVALELFTRKGYDGTSIDDIRNAAGFRSKASLYTHFKGKEEVAKALQEKCEAELSKTLTAAYNGASPEALKRFTRVGRAFIEWALNHPREYAFRYLRVQQEKLMSGEYAYLGETPSGEYTMMMDLLKELRTRYPVRHVADAALLSMMVGLISKAVVDQESFGNVIFEERVRQLMEMCFGILFSESVPLAE